MSEQKAKTPRKHYPKVVLSDKAGTVTLRGELHDQIVVTGHFDKVVQVEDQSWVWHQIQSIFNDGKRYARYLFTRVPDEMHQQWEADLVKTKAITDAQ